MTLEELKDKVRATLKTVFPEQFYVYENDDEAVLLRVNEKIEEIVNTITIVDDNVTEEELTSLTDQGFLVLCESLLEEDADCVCEDKAFELVEWGKNDKDWAVRKKDSIYDELSENYLDLK